MRYCSKQKAIVLNLFFLPAISLSAQPYFFKSFGDSTVDETGVNLVQLSDGTIYYAGFSNFHSDYDFTLLKLSPQGEVIWEKFYRTGNDDFLNGFIKSPTQAAFILAGQSVNPVNQNANGLVIKIDTSGNLIWMDTIGSLVFSESFTGVTETYDKGYAICGNVSDTVGNGFNFLIVRLDSNGIFMWSKTYGGLTNEVSANIVENENKELLIVGDKEVQQSLYNVYVMKTDSSGELLWERNIDYPLNSGCKNLFKTTSGDYVITGEATSLDNPGFDMFLAKINNNGDTIWTKQIGGPHGEHAFAGFETSDHNYLITGFGYNDVNSSTDIILVELDSMGNENVSKRRYYGNSTLETGLGIARSVYGGYLIAGYDIENPDNQYLLIYDDFSLTSSLSTNPLLKGEFGIYPNPAQSHFFIKPTGKTNEDIHLEIFDTAGKLVKHEVLKTNDGKLEINVSVLSEGLYFLNLINAKTFQTKKMIISR